MKKKALVLVAGFSSKAHSEICGHLSKFNVHTAGGITDVRHKMNDNKYPILIVNADSYGNNDIETVHQAQAVNGAITVAVHANKSKRRTIKAENLVFLPRKKLAERLSGIMSESMAV